MGTPDFAVGTLKALVEAGHEVAAVVTQPDKPKGRSKELVFSPVKQEAVKLIADTDKRRMTNYNFYTGQKWGKASNYTLCLNSSQLGYGRCEAVIMECR